MLDNFALFNHLKVNHNYSIGLLQNIIRNSSTFRAMGSCPSVSLNSSTKTFQHSSGKRMYSNSSISPSRISPGCSGSSLKRGPLSIGPGWLVALDSPNAEMSWSIPKYFFSCLNHRASTKYLEEPILNKGVVPFQMTLSLSILPAKTMHNWLRKKIYFAWLNKLLASHDCKLSVSQSVSEYYMF